MSKLADKSMTRREAVQISLLTLGASWVVTGCSKAPTPSNSARPLFFSPEELAQLAEVAEIMIPTTDTPGARAANVHGFIDRMMAHWALAKTQTAFRALLGEIDSSAQARFGAGFMDLSPQQKFDVLSPLD